MKRTTVFLLFFCLLLGGCSAKKAASDSNITENGSALSAASKAEAFLLTDSNGDALEVPADPRTVCLYGSYADAWLSAGGSLVGTTEDAVEERGLDVGNAAIVGTVKEPNTEKIIALDPELVILSADIVPHQEIRDVLEDAGLTCAYFRVDTFADYAAMMKGFCTVTGRDDLYRETVEKPEALIGSVTAAAQKRQTEAQPSVLLIRAFSSGIKAKSDEELAGAILKELGCHNIADDHPSMLEDLSLEEVIEADPDFIFVTTMGSEKKALSYLDSLIAENPAWQELSAVKEGRYVVLPKELFHYKPNARWGESYGYLAEILYPGIDYEK
ncbi:ABC transporter substrate-binding protein [Neglectibacter caecimuris]|uniref:ABC transporter substrate-binding protein n=1 Tax=Neglectibacter caecimuris TaxID=3093658 RepID=UPI002AC901D5|nr:ABC transporter substrate-binding protein [Neglectibacter sp. M00184]